MNDYSGVEATIAGLVTPGSSVLEVGCGTGRWLTRLGPGARSMVGVDPSREMLARAPRALAGRRLVRGVAEALPFAGGLFDLVFAVNATHHFDSLTAFAAEAARVLRPGGGIATVGLDPSTGIDQWYIYDYFPGTRETDQQRYPSADAIRAALREVGFEGVSTSVAQHMPVSVDARAHLQDGAPHKRSASQLLLLSDEEYQAGVDRIWSDILAGETKGVTTTLSADLRLYLTAARLPE